MACGLTTFTQQELDDIINKSNSVSEAVGKAKSICKTLSDEDKKVITKLVNNKSSNTNSNTGASAAAGIAGENKPVDYLQKFLESQETSKYLPSFDTEMMRSAEVMTILKQSVKKEDDKTSFNPELFLGNMFVKGLERTIDYYKEQTALLTEMNTKLGLAGQLSEGFREKITDASAVLMQYGVGISDVTDGITAMYDATGRFSLISEETIVKSGQVGQAYLGSVQKLMAMYPEFEKVGFGAANAQEEIAKAGKAALTVGLQAKKNINEIGSNLSKINEYGFSKGVQGLAEMVRKSNEFRMSMDSVFQVAEKVMSPEGALDMAANLQVLGGAIGDFNDPLKLMYMSTNDVEGLQKSIIGAASSLATYNTEQKKFEITGINLRKARDMAAAMGVSVKDLTSGAIAAAERAQAMSAIMAKGFDVKQENVEFLTNLAQMRDGKMSIELFTPELKDMFSGKEFVALEDLSAEQIEKLNLMREQLVAKDEKQLAKDQASDIENIERYANTILKIMTIEAGRSLKKGANELIKEVTGSDFSELVDELLGKKGEDKVIEARNYAKAEGSKLTGGKPPEQNKKTTTPQSSKTPPTTPKAPATPAPATPAAAASNAGASSTAAVASAASMYAGKKLSDFNQTIIAENKGVKIAQFTPKEIAAKANTPIQSTPETPDTTTPQSTTTPTNTSQSTVLTPANVQNLTTIDLGLLKTIENIDSPLYKSVLNIEKLLYSKPISEVVKSKTETKAAPLSSAEAKAQVIEKTYPQALAASEIEEMAVETARKTDREKEELLPTDKRRSILGDLQPARISGKKFEFPEIDTSKILKNYRPPSQLENIQNIRNTKNIEVSREEKRKGIEEYIKYISDSRAAKMEEMAVEAARNKDREAEELITQDQISNNEIIKKSDVSSTKTSEKFDVNSTMSRMLGFDYKKLLDDTRILQITRDENNLEQTRNTDILNEVNKSAKNNSIEQKSLTSTDLISKNLLSERNIENIFPSLKISSKFAPISELPYQPLNNNLYNNLFNNYSALYPSTNNSFYGGKTLEQNMMKNASSIFNLTSPNSKEFPNLTQPLSINDRIPNYSVLNKSYRNFYGGDSLGTNIIQNEPLSSNLDVNLYSEEEKARKTDREKEELLPTDKRRSILGDLQLARISGKKFEFPEIDTSKILKNFSLPYQLNKFNNIENTKNIEVSREEKRKGIEEYIKYISDSRAAKMEEMAVEAANSKDRESEELTQNQTIDTDEGMRAFLEDNAKRITSLTEINERAKREIRPVIPRIGENITPPTEEFSNVINNNKLISGFNSALTSNPNYAWFYDQKKYGDIVSSILNDQENSQLTYKTNINAPTTNKFNPNQLPNTVAEEGDASPYIGLNMSPLIDFTPPIALQNFIPDITPQNLSTSSPIDRTVLDENLKPKTKTEQPIAKSMGKKDQLEISLSAKGSITDEVARVIYKKYGEISEYSNPREYVTG